MTMTTWALTLLTKTRRPSIIRETSRGLAAPRAVIRVSIDPTRVAAITLKTSMGTEFRVHAPSCAPVRVMSSTASRGSWDPTAEDRSIGVDAVTDIREFPVLRARPRLKAPRPHYRNRQLAKADAAL